MEAEGNRSCLSFGGRFAWIAGATLLAALPVPLAIAANLDPSVRKALEEAKYVYIASQRRDGSWSRSAEIWFLFHQDSVYVGTPPSSWRAKRIRWGRPRARISVGKPDGPVFCARGQIVSDRAVIEKLLDVFPKKYAEGWPQHEQRFRQGFVDGSRVLIRYTPEPCSKN